MACAVFIGLAVLISILSGPSDESSSSLVKKASEENPIPIEQQTTQKMIVNLFLIWNN